MDRKIISSIVCMLKVKTMSGTKDRFINSNKDLNNEAISIVRFIDYWSNFCIDDAISIGIWRQNIMRFNYFFLF